MARACWCCAGRCRRTRRSADAFAQAAKRFGLSIAATRDFIVSNDPRHRDQDNIALLTGDASYDVVYVADTDGTFARGAALRHASGRGR